MLLDKIEEGSSTRMDQDYQDDPDSGNESGCEEIVYPQYRTLDGWATLPHNLLEDIFELLRFKTRNVCMTVCRNWYDILFSPRIWRRLVFYEESFCIRRHNSYGYDLVLSQNRLKIYLSRVGRHVRRIIIPATFSFNNLYEFFSILTCFFHFFYDKYPMPLLEVFEFTFACESRIPVVGPMILGTGGQFLEQLTDLFGAMKNLKHLKMNFLLLEPSDVPRILEKVVNNNSNSLKYLELLDFSKDSCPLFQVGMFRNLRKLVVTPHNTTDDVLLMLADSTELEELIFVQDKYTVDCEPVSPERWKHVLRLIPKLKVRLHVSGIIRTNVLLQERAPVWCITHETPFSRIRSPEMLRIVENYKYSLRVYGHLMLPRKHGPRSFHYRGDAGLVLLVRHCPNLQKLYIRERISSATLLIIAHEGKSLKELKVRKNAVILKSDWPKPPNWEEWRYCWLKKTARSYDSVQDAISMMLNKKWHLMSDAEYMKLTVPF